MSSIYDSKRTPVGAQITPQADPYAPTGPLGQATSAQRDGQTPAGSVNDSQAQAAIASGTGPIDLKKVRMLALAGLAPADADSVTRTTATTNKFSADSAVLQKDVPLPPDAPSLERSTGQLYASMGKDMTQALAATQTDTDAQTKAAMKKVGNAVAGVAAAPANTPQAQAATKTLGNAVDNMTSMMGKMAAALMGGDCMAAFLVLQVENKSSGKEVDSAMQDLLTQGRNASLKQQAQENKIAAEKAESAWKKQQILKKLGPIIDLIVTAICLAVTVMTAGEAGPAMFALAASVVGFLAGGVAGGAKNHDGFDLAGAATGAGIGAAITGPLKLVLEAALRMLVKVCEMAGLRAAAKFIAHSLEKMRNFGSKGVEAAGENALKNSAKVTEERNAEQAESSVLKKERELEAEKAAEGKAKPDNSADDGESVKSSVSSLGSALTRVSALASKTMKLAGGKSESELRLLAETAERKEGEHSVDDVFKRLFAEQQSKYNQIGSIATTSMGIGNQLSLAIASYVETMQNADAKQHEANAKEQKVLAENYQNAWEALQDQLSGNLQNHSQVVNQAVQMQSSHYQAMSNTVKNIVH